MRKTSVAAAVLVLASLPFAVSAAPTATFHGAARAAASPDATASVLYDQSANDSGIGIVSQNFESLYDAFDSQAADDFTVPAGATWVVTEIDVTGVYFNGPGPARDENVTFYKDKSGKPGSVVKTVTVAGTDDGFGSFKIKLPKVKLKAGTYWVSVQANMDFTSGAGEWGWENQSTAEGALAMWKNPGDGFATGCTKYKTENVCIPDGQGDHMFVLKGKVK